MKPVTQRIVTGGISAIATVGIIGASTLGTVSAHGDKHGSWGPPKGGHGEQYFNERIQAYFDLNTALHEHASLGINALKAKALSAPDADAAQMALGANSTMIAENVDILYPDTQEKFTELWNAHLGYYNDYLAAAQANDAAGKETAKQNLEKFAKDTDELLSRKMHTLNQDKDKGNDANTSRSLEEQLKTHSNQTMAAIDQLVAGDYEAMYTTARDAYNHMEMVARSMGMSWYGGMSKHHRH